MKSRTAGDRIRELSTQRRDAEALAEFYEGELRTNERRAQKLSLVLNALLQKFPEDVQEALLVLGISGVGDASDQEIGALVAHIQHLRHTL